MVGMILTFWGLSNQIKVPTWSSLSLPFAAREICKYVGPCWLEMWFHFLQRKFCHVTLNRFPITKAELHLCLGKFIPASKLKNFTKWSDWQEKDQMLVTRPQLLRFGQEYRENACDFLAALLHEEGKPEEAELATCPAGSGASWAWSFPWFYPAILWRGKRRTIYPQNTRVIHTGFRHSI